MSEPVTVTVRVAVLLALLPSFVAPVDPLSVEEPTVVGVPETVQVITPDGATEAGGVGVHDVVRPAGRPVTAQDAFVAVTAGAAAFEQVNVPEYGTPMLADVGSPVMLIDISDCTTETEAVAELLPPVVVPPLLSLVAPVVAVTVTEPDVVGVPETEHEMLEPAATVAGGVGVQVPTVTPAGRPLIAQVALSALAVAVALFVQSTVPE